MATRDQWYKPNLLYNIHYRPPKKAEPPTMIVETSLFNPSVCTCGEHGCEPKYRMERRVLWSNKERDAVKQEDKTGEEQKATEVKDLEEKSNIRSSEGSGDMERVDASDNKEQRVQEKEGTKEYVNRGLHNSVGVQECGVSDDGKFYTDGVGRNNNGGCVKGDVEVGFCDGMIKTDSIGRKNNDGGSPRSDSEVGDGNGIIKAGSVGRRNNDDGSVRSDTRIDFGNGKINIDGVVTRRNNDESVRDEGGICIEKGFTEVVRRKLSDDGSIRSDDRGDVGNGKKNFNSVRNHGKYVGRAKVLCSSGIDDRKAYIDRVGSQNNHGGSVKCDGDESVASQSKNGGATTVHCNGNTEDEDVCQNEDVETEELDEEISSAFGIMSVYCNSELHSWRMVIGEGNAE